MSGIHTDLASTHAPSRGTRPGERAMGGADATATLSARSWALRLVWIAIQIILVCWFAQKGLLFVYQGF